MCDKADHKIEPWPNTEELLSAHERGGEIKFKVIEPTKKDIKNLIAQFQPGLVQKVEK